MSRPVSKLKKSISDGVIDATREFELYIRFGGSPLALGKFQGGWDRLREVGGNLRGIGRDDASIKNAEILLTESRGGRA